VVEHEGTDRLGWGGRHAHCEGGEGRGSNSFRGFWSAVADTALDGFRDKASKSGVEPPPLQKISTCLLFAAPLRFTDSCALLPHGVLSLMAVRSA